MKTALALFAVLALSASAVGTEAVAKAAPCKDAKGKFIKCSAAAAPAAVAVAPAKPAPAAVPAPAPAPVAAAPAAKKPSILGSLLAKKSAAAPAATATTTKASTSSVTTSSAGATAQCKDGSFSHAKTHSGACSRHGGVAKFL